MYLSYTCSLFFFPVLFRSKFSTCFRLFRHTLTPSAINQVQHKLNRVATSSGSANPYVAISALLEVMAGVHTKSAEVKEQEAARKYEVRMFTVSRD